MKRLMMITLACAALGISVTPASANDDHHPKADAQKSYAAKGEVVEVDKDAGKVKLKHEAVSELKWPAMTMFFAVADKSQLDALKAGEQVEFEFVKPAGGSARITQIKAVK